MSSGYKNCKAGIVSALALMAVAGAVVGQAHAEAAEIKNSDFSITSKSGFDVINIHSSDGKAWDTFSGPPVKFLANGFVEAKWPGFTGAYAFYLGHCNTNGCSPGTISWKDTEVTTDSTGQTYNPVTIGNELSLPMDQIPTSVGGGIPISPLGDELLGYCNAQLTPWGATKDYAFPHTLKLTLAVDTRKSWKLKMPKTVGGDEQLGNNGTINGDHVKRDTMRVMVNCNKYESDVDLDDYPNQDLDYEDVQLFLSTFSNAVTHPDENTTCKKGRILVRARTNQEGPVDLRIHTVGGNEQGQEFLQAWSSHVGSGVYEAEVTRWVTTDETTDVQVKAVVEKSTWEHISSGWEQVTLECVTDTPDFKPAPEPGDEEGPGWKN